MKKISCFFTLTFIMFLGLSLVMGGPVESSRSYGWGIVNKKDGNRPDPGRLYEDLLSRHNAVYIDKVNDKNLYLTFDAGYENKGYTNQILDVLKRQHVKVTFFLTGQYLEENPDIVRRMVSDGHIVGNHTYYHPDLTKVNRSRYVREIELFEQKYTEITKQKPLKIMRPPSGTFNEQSLQIADDLGYYNIFWSLAYPDWDKNDERGGDYAYEQIMKRMHPGAIILLHNVSKANTEGLERVIVDLKKEGYRFASLSDLILQNELYVSYNY